jgi:4-hydroxybenzoate polyprenyltransferase
MDDEFDRSEGIHSLVQTLGIARALNAARIFHAIFVALLAGFGVLAAMSTVFFGGVLAIAFVSYLRASSGGCFRFATRQSGVLHGEWCH